jgi:xanthine dehydrogenase accessory factor
MMDMKFLSLLEQIANGKKPPAVMVLVVATQDSSPQIPGARMLVGADGLLDGTVGGGTIEKLAIDHAVGMMKNGTHTDFRTYDMNRVSNENIATGMLCGGTISLYFEHIAGAERLIIYGCGHIGSVLAPMAARCGFHVVAVDHREEMADPDRFEGETGISVLCANPVEHARSLTVSYPDTIVIMTHNHQFDAAVLKALTEKLTHKTFPRYIGMIGSASKVGTILDNLQKEGVLPDVLNQVRTPIGLRIGGNSPAEIAVSIMSEILSVKYRKGEAGLVKSMSGR